MFLGISLALVKNEEIAMTPKIRNFRQVNQVIYRGGQPTDRGIADLAEMGIRTVISFRKDQAIIEAESELVQEHAMIYQGIPLSYVPGPSHAQVVRFFSIVNNPANHPIYMHCLLGCDRTGLMAAMWRVAQDAWHVDQAYDEMRQCGFHNFRLPHFRWILYGYSWLLQREILSPDMT